MKQYFIVLSFAFSSALFSMEKELKKLGQIKLITSDGICFAPKEHLLKPEIFKNMIDAIDADTRVLDVSMHPYDEIKKLTELLTIEQIDPTEKLDTLFEKAYIADKFNVPILKNLCSRIAALIPQFPERNYSVLTPELDALIGKEIVKQHEEVFTQWRSKFLCKHQEKMPIATGKFYISRNNKYLISQKGKLSIGIRDLITNIYKEIQSKGELCLLTPDSQKFIICDYDGEKTFSLWNIIEGTKLKEVPIPCGAHLIKEISISSDGKFFLIYIYDDTHFRWNLDDNTVTMHAFNVVEVNELLSDPQFMDFLRKKKFEECGGMILGDKACVSHSDDKHIIYDIKTGKELWTLLFFPYFISNNHNFILKYEPSAIEVQVFSVKNGKHKFTLHSSKTIRYVSATSDNESIYFLDGDTILKQPLKDSKRKLRSLTVTKLLKIIKKYSEKKEIV